MTQFGGSPGSGDRANELRLEKEVSPSWMFFTAALFGLFGFFYGQPAPGTQLVPVTVAYLYTCRICAILFAISGVLAMVRPPIGAGFNAFSGVACVVGLVITGVLDLMDPKYTSPIPLVLLIVLAAWNAVVVYKEIRLLLFIRRVNQGFRQS